jgi:hypothetical protein
MKTVAGSGSSILSKYATLETGLRPGLRPGFRFRPRYDARMTGEEAVLSLTELARAAGVEVRIERFELKQLAGKGGLCRIRGLRVILVDATLAPIDQAGVLGEALGRIDLTGLDIPAALTPFLRSGHGKVRALFRPRPLARGARPKPR